MTYSQGGTEMNPMNIKPFAISARKVSITPQQRIFSIRVMILSGIYLVMVGIFLMVTLLIFDPDVKILGFFYYILLLVVYIRMFFVGYQHRLLLAPIDIPYDFVDYDTVYNSLRKKRLVTFGRDLSISSSIFRTFFGSRFDFFISQIKRRIHSTIGSLFGYFFGLGWAVFLFIIIYVEQHTINYYFTIFLLLLAYWICAVCLFYGVIVNLTPKYSPKANVHYDLQEYSGSHPGRIHRNVTSMLEKLNYDYPRRFKSLPPELYPIAVGDTGTTYGNMFIESIPDNEANVENEAYMNGMILSLYASFFMGACVTITPILLLFKFEPFLLFFIFYCWFILMIQHMFFSLSRALAISYFWKSKIILIEISGEYYRSNIGVGTGSQDSLKSERLSIISDVTARYHGTEVTSQSVGISSYREMINLGHSQEIIDAFNILNKHLEVGNQVVDVQIPNIEHPNVQKLANLNVQISRARGLQQPKPASAFLSAGTTPSQMLTSGDQRSKSDSMVSCPNCGEKIPGSVKFCDYCGHDFQRKSGTQQYGKRIICPHCSNDNPENVPFCTMCGGDLRQQRTTQTGGMEQTGENWFCPACNKFNVGSWNICPWCGGERSKY